MCLSCPEIEFWIMAARAPCKRHLTRLCRSTPDKLPSSRAWASSVGGRSVRPLGMHAAQMMSPTRHFPAGNAGLSKNIFARPSCPWPTSSVTLPLSRQMRLKHGGKKGEYVFELLEHKYFEYGQARAEPLRTLFAPPKVLRSFGDLSAASKS